MTAHDERDPRGMDTYLLDSYLDPLNTAQRSDWALVDNARPDELRANLVNALQRLDALRVLALHMQALGDAHLGGVVNGDDPALHQGVTLRDVGRQVSDVVHGSIVDPQNGRDSL